MPKFTRTGAYVRRTFRGIDERIATAAQRGDPYYLPRLSWSTSPRFPYDDRLLLEALRKQSNTALFLDNSFIDDRTSTEIVQELLATPGRLHVTNEVRKELRPYLQERPSHPLAVALAQRDPAIVFSSGLRPEDPGRMAMEYYVSLLLRRRIAGDVVRQNLAEARGINLTAVDPAEVRMEAQRRYGERGLLIAEKPASPLATDELLVYRAVEYAIRSGQTTAILTHDHDLEEQFFKLTYLMTGHYKAMLCANQYARDFATFKTTPLVRRTGDEDWWPFFEGGSVLVDAARWGLRRAGFDGDVVSRFPALCLGQSVSPDPDNADEPGGLVASTAQ